MTTESDIGAMIKEARNARHLNQEEFLTKAIPSLEWTQRTLSRVETGERRLLFSEAIAVAKDLGVSVTDLLPIYSGRLSESANVKDAARTLSDLSEVIANAAASMRQFADTHGPAD